MVMNSQMSLEDRDSATFIKMPNTKRNPLIYGGELDKYYIGYFAKVKDFVYKIKNPNVVSIKLNISNKEEALPVYEQVHVDSLIITGKIN
jgi:hypothetical protein